MIQDTPDYRGKAKGGQGLSALGPLGNMSDCSTCEAEVQHALFGISTTKSEFQPPRQEIRARVAEKANWLLFCRSFRVGLSLKGGGAFLNGPRAWLGSAGWVPRKLKREILEFPKIRGTLSRGPCNKDLTI